MIVLDDDSSAPDSLNGIVRNHIFFGLIHPSVQRHTLPLSFVDFEFKLINTIVHKFQIVFIEVDPNRRSPGQGILLEEVSDAFLEDMAGYLRRRGEMNCIVIVGSEVYLWGNRLLKGECCRLQYFSHL